MTNYWDKCFISKLNDNINVIFEVGSRYGDETLKLAQIFENAEIYSFECNPNTINICKKKLEGHKNIHFIDKGLGSENETKPFYSYICDNDGASSFYKRIDSGSTQKLTGYIEIKKISDIMKYYKIDNIDLLCMDVQGFELNVIQGAEEYINKIKYVIMEEPKSEINLRYLPKDIYSKYINAPTPIEIKKFMTQNNFVEVERVSENEIEDNVMYKNILN